VSKLKINKAFRVVDLLVKTLDNSKDLYKIKIRRNWTAKGWKVVVNVKRKDLPSIIYNLSINVREYANKDVTVIY